MNRHLALLIAWIVSAAVAWAILATGPTSWWRLLIALAVAAVTNMGGSYGLERYGRRRKAARTTITKGTST